MLHNWQIVCRHLAGAIVEIECGWHHGCGQHAAAHTHYAAGLPLLTFSTCSLNKIVCSTQLKETGSEVVILQFLSLLVTSIAHQQPCARVLLYYAGHQLCIVAGGHHHEQAAPCQQGGSGLQRRRFGTTVKREAPARDQP